MTKHLFAAAVAAPLCVSPAIGQSLVQRSDWQDRKFETYLPKPSATVPWLEINPKTKLPKGDLPIGRDVASGAASVLPLAGPDVRMSTHIIPALRSM